MPIKTWELSAESCGPIGFSGSVEHMLVPIGPRQFREKPGAYGKPLEVFEILHMGCAVGKSGLHYRSRPVDPSLLYHTGTGLSIGKTAQKNCPLSGQFDELAIKCGTQTEIASQSQTSKKVSHSITTNYFQGQQGCIRPCIPQRNCHSHNSYS